MRKVKKPMTRTVYAPRLRVLIDPVYIQSANLTSSSTYHKYVTLVRELVKRGHYCYWCVPDADYVPKEIEDHPNVGIIRTSYIQDQFVVDGLVTDKFFNLFNRVAGEYHIDVLVTSRTSLALYYKRLLEPPRFHDNDGEFTDKGYGLPIVILEEFPQTQRRQNSGKAYWLCQCLGYYSADRTVFLSDHNREEVTQGMLDYMSAGSVAEYLEKVRVIPAGVETKELDQLYAAERWKLEKGFNVLSIGRIFGASYIEYVPWFDYLYQGGMSDATLTISLSGALSGPMRHKLEKIGYDLKNNVGRQLRVIENNPRKNFLRMLRKFHCFIVPVSHLDHPTGIFEALYLGLPGVLPVSDYQQTFFKDYPFVIEPKDKAGLLAQLLWIKENPEEARRLVAPWRDIIREKYDAPANICKLADEIEGAARGHIDRFRTSAGVLNLLRELKGDVYTWPDIVAYLRKSGRMGVSIGDMGIRTTFTYARGAIHHSMRLVGFVDTCEGPHEKFMRREKFDAQEATRAVLPQGRKGAP
jgi:glycosyltransferase involved in cell wall biosynthesis